MTIRCTAWLFGAAALLSASLAGAQTPQPDQIGPASNYVPHRAVYDLVLVPGRDPDKSPVQSARARLLYDYRGSVCEGWTTEQRFVLELTPQEGEPQVSDQRVTTFENIQNKEFRFLTRTTIDGVLREEADGVATQDKNNQLKIALKKPAKRDVAPGGNILFPTQHVTAVLAAAQAGEKIIEIDLFDGSENGDKIYATTSIIGRPRQTPLEGEAATKAELLGKPRWPLNVSFFDKVTKGNGEQLPAYELSIEIFENGVTYSMLLNYSNFALKGTLTSVEFFPLKPCK